MMKMTRWLLLILLTLFQDSFVRLGTLLGLAAGYGSLQVSHFLEGTAQLGQAFSDGIPPHMIPGELQFRDPEKREEGETPPPECDGEKGPAHGFCGIGKTEPGGIEGHHHIQQKKDSSSEVAHCVSQAGDGIHRFFICLLYTSPSPRDS